MNDSSFTITLHRGSTLPQAAKDIRHQVFVIEQQVPEAEEWDEHDLTAQHLLCYHGATAVGTCRYRRTLSGVKLERFAVLKEWRGKGAGAALLLACKQQLVQGVVPPLLYLHAQEHAVGFYARYGFVKVGPLFYECEIPHYKMILNNKLPL